MFHSHNIHGLMGPWGFYWPHKAAWCDLKFTQNLRKKKERFGCGVHFSEGHSRIFFT